MYLYIVRVERLKRAYDAPSLRQAIRGYKYIYDSFLTVYRIGIWSSYVVVLRYKIAKQMIDQEKV